jgi:hypothetical protein
MKAIASTVLAALLAVTNARFLDTTTTAYSVATPFVSTLNCGQCILGGFNFCIKQAEGTTVATDPTASSANSQVCCNPGATCTAVTGTSTVEGTYSCSNSYYDRAYSLNVCPINTNYCG